MGIQPVPVPIQRLDNAATLDGRPTRQLICQQ